MRRRGATPTRSSWRIARIEPARLALQVSSSQGHCARDGLRHSLGNLAGREKCLALTHNPRTVYRTPCQPPTTVLRSGSANLRKRRRRKPKGSARTPSMQPLKPQTQRPQKRQRTLQKMPQVERVSSESAAARRRPREPHSTLVWDPFSGRALGGPNQKGRGKHRAQAKKFIHASAD
jgi:hypothetical protein